MILIRKEKSPHWFLATEKNKTLSEDVQERHFRIDEFHSLLSPIDFFV